MEAGGYLNANVHFPEDDGSDDENESGGSEREWGGDDVAGLGFVEAGMESPSGGVTLAGTGTWIVPKETVSRRETVSPPAVTTSEKPVLVQRCMPKDNPGRRPKK